MQNLQKDKNTLELYVNNKDAYFEKASGAIRNLLKENNINSVEIVKAQKRHHEIGFKLKRIINATI